MAQVVTSGHVPFVDLTSAYDELRQPLDEAVARVTASGRYLLGAELEGFEESFARFVGTRHCVGVGSGLDALTLAMQAFGIGAGDEVIVPGNTFVGTWIAVSRVGATPVPVDPEITSHNIDPERLAAAITPRTRLIVPVHLYGLPARMSDIAALAADNGVLVLEDAAQAHGARYDGTRVGAIGDAAAWSFYPSKNLGAFGDGGAVTTDDDDLAEQLRMLRNYGSAKKHDYPLDGINSRLDEIQAAVLRVKLEVLDEWNDRRRTVAARYLERLADTSLVLPVVPDHADPVWHLFVARSSRRNMLLEELGNVGIGAAVHYPVAPHNQPIFARLGLSDDALPVSAQLQHEVLSLPMGPHLSPDQVDHVIDSVRALDG